MGPLSSAFDQPELALRVTTLNSQTGVNTPLDVNVTSSSTQPTFVKSAGYTYLHISALTTGTLVKTGSGVLHSLTVNNVGAAATITVYDGTSTSGTEIAVIGGTITFGNVLYDALLTTGLYIVVAGTTSPDITLTYE